MDLFVLVWDLNAPPPFNTRFTQSDRGGFRRRLPHFCGRGSILISPLLLPSTLRTHAGGGDLDPDRL